MSAAKHETTPESQHYWINGVYDDHMIYFFTKTSKYYKISVLIYIILWLYNCSVYDYAANSTRQPRDPDWRNEVSVLYGDVPNLWHHSGEIGDVVFKHMFETIVPNLDIHELYCYDNDSPSAAPAVLPAPTVSTWNYT